MAFVVMLAAGITLAIALLGLWSPLKTMENNTLDWRFQLRNKFRPVEKDPRIVLCQVDDFSQTQFGAWPFPRSRHAQLLAFLADEKPSVVTCDFLFKDPKPDAADQDDLLVQGAKLFPNFISGAAKAEQGERAIPPLDKIGPTRPLTQVTGDFSKLTQYASAQLPFDTYTKADGTEGSSLLQNSLFGFVDADSDPDNTRRYLPMIIGYQNKAFASLSLLTILKYLHTQDSDVVVHLGKEIVIQRPGQSALHIPINENGEMLVNYRLKLGQFESISYFGMLYLLSGKAHLDQARANDPQFEQKLKQLPALTDNIVVLGLTGKGLVDTGATPLEKNSPLVILHLNALYDVLNQDFVYPVSPTISLALIFLFLSLLGAALLRVNLLFITVVGLLSIVCYFLFAQFLFQYIHIIIPVALPMIAILVTTLAVTAYLYFGENKQKQQIKAAMAAYIPERVMQRVLEHPEMLKLGGDKRELTVLFCDIRGFTKYCDNRDPQEVVAVLNEYMEIMSDVIFQFEGTIDKYIGDCIMAFWNAPEDQPDHAQRAVTCAIAMRYALATYKTKRAGIDSEIFECGIGIHTGPALVGNVGSTRRLNYTTIGSTVNMAARLEALTKRFTSRIIISESTRAQLTGEVPLTDLGEVLVPGFSQKTHLYSVEAQQDINSALLVGKKVAYESNVSVSHVEAPIWPAAPLPDDAESDEQGKG